MNIVHLHFVSTKHAISTKTSIILYIDVKNIVLRNINCSRKRTSKNVKRANEIYQKTGRNGYQIFCSPHFFVDSTYIYLRTPKSTSENFVFGFDFYKTCNLDQNQYHIVRSYKQYLSKKHNL